MPPRLAAPADELPTVRKKKREYVSDSDEDVNIFDNPKFRRNIKTTTTPDSDDDKPLFPELPELSSQAAPLPSPPPPAQPPTQQPQPNWQPNFINNPIVTNARVRRQLEKVVNGGDSIKFQSPGPGANLEGQVELLIQAAEHFPQVKSIELQAISTLFYLIMSILIPFVSVQGVLIGDMPAAFQAVLDFVMYMRNGGRKLKFLGLNATSLSDYQGQLLANMIGTLGPTKLDREEWEKIELDRIAFSEPTRPALKVQVKDAGDRNGVNVILSRERWPALSF